MKKKKTTEQFIIDAKKVHGNKYDYSETIYTASREKIKIKCPIHGEFWSVANTHLQGCGCPKCAGNVRLDANTFTIKAKETHKNKYNYSKVVYKDSKTKVCIICPEHGEFWQIPANHLNGQGCPKCKNDVIRHSKLHTLEQFISKAFLKHGKKYNYSKAVYKNSFTKLCIICPTHGEFWQDPTSHLSGSGCPKCRNEALHQRFKKSEDTFIKQAKSIHGEKYKYDKVNYVNTHTKVCIICPKHGEFWQYPHQHLSGNGCSKCSGLARLTTKSFIEKAEKVHGKLYNYSSVEYVNSRNKVKITCPIHGDFYQTPSSHLSGYGCPKCILKSQNKLFEKLKEVLQEELVWEYTTDWLEKQRIDIFIPKYNIGVEYNGRQHYDPVKAWGGDEGLKITQQRDSLKLEKCNNHGVKLLYLKYDYSEQDFENLVQNIHKIIENNT